MLAAPVRKSAGNATECRNGGIKGKKLSMDVAIKTFKYTYTFHPGD
jgi:hypothetical protein